MAACVVLKCQLESRNYKRKDLREAIYYFLGDSANMIFSAVDLERPRGQAGNFRDVGTVPFSRKTTITKVKENGKESFYW